MIKEKTFGSNYVPLKNLVLLSKYYYYLGHSTREVKKLLIDICRKVDTNFNLTTQGWKITLSIKESKKRRLRIPISIAITVSELEKIREIDDYNLEKVLFTFLIYAKYLKYNNTLIHPKSRPRLLGLFYCNEKLTNIFSVAKVDVSKSRRIEMAHILYLSGYIDATRFGGYNIKYVFEDSSEAFTIDKYDDLVLYYLRWRGEQVSTCSCGRLFMKKSPTHIYCPVCSKRIRKERTKERVERFRKK